MVYERSSSLAALAFAAVLSIFFLKRRPREIHGREANNSAAANNGTAAGASSAHASSEGQEIDTLAGHEFEVFLSFRGPDTRSGFTDFLYTSLDDAGIRTFKDNEELRVGEEFEPKLLQAINESKISIPILSKGYASSVWCLKELVQMVKCQKIGTQKIKPIFYDVAPAEVRYQTGDYAKAFDLHKQRGRYDEKTIQEWKDALTKVGEINGWNLHNVGKNRQEGAFAKTVTRDVFNDLKKASLVVPDSFVEVDDTRKIKDMIAVETSETRIIGIHGMGGIGKTTIAKKIYNELSNNFKHCCFLPNIRETSERKGIEYLQHQLICTVLKMELPDIKNMEDGIKIIKDRLRTTKVLLLLDDVDRKEHIDALVGKRNWFGIGSKLIITTRNKEVLEFCDVDNFHEVNCMDRDQSLQLFCKLAFRRDSPLDEDIGQSNRAIGIAGGLPLALEIIGSLLQHTKKEEWDATLEKLASVPRNEVQSKLKISYDALNFRQQYIFLDIACLFIGYDKDILIRYWDRSFFPEEAMKVLQNLSLIKIGENNEVWMHDQLRDLGREMVCEKSKMNIEKQSRVWKEGLKLLGRPEGKKEVEALRLQLDKQRQYCFTYEGFKNLLDLRFLEVDGSMEDFHAEDRILWHELASDILATDEDSCLLPQLRWLSWQDIPPTFNITNFSMKEVVILDLSFSEITDDWSGWSHMKVMKNLKSLDLSKCCNIQRLPDKLGSNLENLEYLSLRGCDSLEMLPDTLGNLKSLDLSNCQNIRRLPDKLYSNLESLEYLSLRGCKSLEMLPDTIGNLESLIKLDISRTSINELPDSIGKLKNLKVVKMEWCGVRKIPHAFWTIEKLEEIEVEKSYSQEDLHVRIGDGIYRNRSLRILRLAHASIHALPPRLPESLIKLELSTLQTDMFPDLSNLNNLKELNLTFSSRRDGNWQSYGFVGDPMPRWIGNLSKLESLSLTFLCETPSPAEISLPPRLKSLSLSGLPNLRYLPKLPSSLSSLRLQSCRSLCSMEDVSNLKDLSSLHIWDAAITEIPGLGCLENLRDLNLWSLKQVQILPDLSSLNILRDLNVYFCDNLVEIQGELPRCLDSLRISSCPSLRNLPDLSSLVGEQQVEIERCGNLNVEAILGFARKNPRDLKFVGFDQLHIPADLSESLEKLVVSSCEALYKLPDLSSLMRLREVFLSSCAKLVEIEGELPESLEILNISECKSLLKLPDLSCLKKLQRVDIGDCTKLEGEAILGSSCRSQANLWENLQYLRICGLGQLKILPDLSNSSKLTHLRVEKCGNLVEIQGQLPESLKELEISSCESLQKLPDLLSLKGLRRLKINHCGKLNVKVNSWLCSGKLVKYEIEYRESEFNCDYEPEGEDQE